ncbi:hypothetical protein [Flavobacterium sp.]|uniref:hypothetical protein n=1 Tax=Flavobacterium sp. TaxID=239 RepID=UPI0037526565
MIKFLYLFLIVFLLQNSVVFSQSKINKSKKELNTNSGSKTTTTTSSSSNSNNNRSNNSNVFADIFVNITWGIFKYGFIGDYKNENHLNYNLTKYPYYNGKSGNFENAQMDSVSKNKARLDIENSFVYNSNSLFGNHLKAKIRPFQYLYFQSDFHQLFEINKIDNTNSRLSLFQFNLNYDRIRFEKFNFGWNLGATYVGNEVKKVGLAYGLNAEYFMNNNLSFSAASKWSQINNLPVNTLEFQSKFHKKNYFFSLGLEHLKIATPTYNFIALGGGIYF